MNKHNDYFQRKGLPNPMNGRIIAPNGTQTSVPVRIQHQDGPSAQPISTVFPMPDGSVRIMAIGGLSKLETVAAQVLPQFASNAGDDLDLVKRVQRAVDYAQCLLQECRNRERTVQEPPA